MAEDRGQRTETATPRRREEAVKKGQFAVSSDLSAGVLLVAAVCSLWMFGDQIGEQLMGILGGGIMASTRRQLEAVDILELTRHAMWQFVLATGLIVGICYCVQLAMAMIQVGGFRVSAERMQIKWDKISLTGGWGKIFSWKATVRGVAAVFKVIGFGGVVAWVVSGQLRTAVAGSQVNLMSAVISGTEFTLILGFAIAIVLLTIGIADYLFQRWNHEQELKMTLREVQDERRDEEGDPHMRARLRKLQREMAQNRMIQDVASATVVVRNPTHFAVALRYERGVMAAPEVVAKGTDLVAQRIIKAAEENGVAVVERKPLARALYAAVDIGQVIPVELYQAVAEVLSYVWGRTAA